MAHAPQQMSSMTSAVLWLVKSNCYWVLIGQYNTLLTVWGRCWGVCLCQRYNVLWLAWLPQWIDLEDTLEDPEQRWWIHWSWWWEGQGDEREGETCPQHPTLVSHSEVPWVGLVQYQVHEESQVTACCPNYCHNRPRTSNILFGHCNSGSNICCFSIC